MQIFRGQELKPATISARPDKLRFVCFWKEQWTTWWLNALDLSWGKETKFLNWCGNAASFWALFHPRYIKLTATNLRHFWQICEKNEPSGYYRYYRYKDLSKLKPKQNHTYIYHFQLEELTQFDSPAALISGSHCWNNLLQAAGL